MYDMVFSVNELSDIYVGVYGYRTAEAEVIQNKIIIEEVN